jgi:hypothetical protein
MKLSGLLALLTAGVLCAWTIAAAGRAADTAPVDTTTVAAATDTAAAAADTTFASDTTAVATDTAATATDTSTFPTTTEVATTTVQQTTTRVVPLPLPAATTSTESHENGTPAWVWVLLGILAAGLIVLIVLLARRGHGGVSVEERRRQLDAAVGSWAGQGWAVESETGDSAVLRRGDEAMLVTVDQAGHVSTRPMPRT